MRQVSRHRGWEDAAVPSFLGSIVGHRIATELQKWKPIREAQRRLTEGW